MKARRRVVLLTLAVSFVATLILGSIALNTQSDAVLADQQERASPAVPGAPKLGSDPESAATRDGGPSGFSLFLAWAGAVASGGVLIVSFLVFRVEVRREKDRHRAQEQREEYRKQLRRYNEQLKGPPRHNT